MKETPPNGVIIPSFYCEINHYHTRVKTYLIFSKNQRIERSAEKNNTARE